MRAKYIDLILLTGKIIVADYICKQSSKFGLYLIQILSL